MAGLTNAQMAARRKPAFQRRGQTGVYRRYVSDTKSFATGEVTFVYTDTTIENALIWQLDHVTITQSNGRYRVGDRAIRIMNEQFPYTQPVLRDVFQIASDQYTIIDWYVTGDGQSFTLICRKP